MARSLLITPSQAFYYSNRKPTQTALTRHDPLRFIGLHVASAFPLSGFALEVILGIKRI